MPDAAVEQVKERTDIVQLIGEHVRLKRAGANFKGLCPFHREDTPSFVVSPGRQMFHCFGCSASGDVFSWLMKKEGMTFPEALRVLAQRAGVPLTFERAERREQRERLRATLDTAAEFYHAILLKTSSGQDAREYLRKRGITDESIAAWRLGYVPLVSTAIIEKAGERGVTTQDLLDAGIIAQGPRGPYERFYGRLLFPLTDAHGSVVGFAGRVLDTDARAPAAKYVNTPETTLYTKGKILYGLDKARDAIRREGLAVIVEGYTDVLTSHQAGVAHVVATSGTALTDEHLRLLKRFTDALAFAFDADAAGDEATRRALDLAIAAGFSVSVVSLPAGSDPADLAVRDVSAWRQAIRDRAEVFTFLLKRAVARHAVDDPAGKKAVARDLLPLLARVPDAVVRGDYLQRLAAAVRVDVKFLHEDLDALRTAPEPSRSVPSATAAASASAANPPPAHREERFLALLLAAPAVFPVASEYLPPDAFTDSRTRLLYEALKAWYDHRRAAGAPVDFSRVEETLPQDLRRLVEVFRLNAEVEQEEHPSASADRDARLLLRDLLSSHLRRQLQDIARELDVVSSADRRALLQRVMAITAELARAEHLTI